MSPPIRLLLMAAALALTGLVSLRAAEPQAKLSAEEEKVLELTNEARKKENLPPLKLNAVLCAAAQAHSANMAAKGELKHVLDGKKPADRVKAAGYDYDWVGENIAYTSGDPPAEVFRRWMESPEHKENILRDKFTEIGVAVAQSANGDLYYTQVFGSPRKKRGQ